LLLDGVNLIVKRISSGAHSRHDRHKNSEKNCTDCALERILQNGIFYVCAHA
jgi:hypothetical protein